MIIISEYFDNKINKKFIINLRFTINYCKNRYKIILSSNKIIIIVRIILTRIIINCKIIKINLNLVY